MLAWQPTQHTIISCAQRTCASYMQSCTHQQGAGGDALRLEAPRSSTDTPRALCCWMPSLCHGSGGSICQATSQQVSKSLPACRARHGCPHTLRSVRHEQSPVQDSSSNNNVSRVAQAPRAQRAPAARRHASTRPTRCATAPWRRAPPAPTTCAPTRPPVSASTRPVRAPPCCRAQELAAVCFAWTTCAMTEPYAFAHCRGQPAWNAAARLCTVFGMRARLGEISASATAHLQQLEHIDLCGLRAHAQRRSGLCLSSGCGAGCKAACTLRVCWQSHPACSMSSAMIITLL